MLVHFQPADSPSSMASENPDPATVQIPHVERPLSVVTVPDRAMKPELHPGQQVLVQNFRVQGVSYLEQRMAWEIGGRTIIRRGQVVPGGLRLFGNQDGHEVMLERPDGWEPPPDWRTTGVVHPNCTVLGPLVYAYRSRQGGRDKYLATVGWSN